MNIVSKKLLQSLVVELGEMASSILDVVELEQQGLEAAEEASPAAQELDVEIEMLEASLEVLQELTEILQGAIE